MINEASWAPMGAIGDPIPMAWLESFQASEFFDLHADWLNVSGSEHIDLMRIECLPSRRIQLWKPGYDNPRTESIQRDVGCVRVPHFLNLVWMQRVGVYRPGFPGTHKWYLSAFTRGRSGEVLTLDACWIIPLSGTVCCELTVQTAECTPVWRYAARRAFVSYTERTTA